MKPHGWLGLAIILGAEAALFGGQPLVAHWFTPIVWTGYVLFVDALAAWLTGRSYLTTDRVEGVLLALTSIACWWLFELYNSPRFWRGGTQSAGLWWHYHGLEPNPFLRRVGYDWAFATIFPALFLTATVLRTTVFRRMFVRPSHRLSREVHHLLVAAGVLAAALPLVLVSAWLVPLVWVAFALLLEPLNSRAGRPSWLADLRGGNASRLFGLLGAGLVCGVLWEFWNYWAATKWTYTVPYVGGLKIFEMPVLGYLGFPAFALECFAMYHWLRGVLRAAPAPPLP